MALRGAAPTGKRVKGVVLPEGPFTVNDGGFAQGMGFYSTDVAGGTLSKQHYRNYTYDGIRIMQWPAQPSTGTWFLSDIISENVSETPPRSGNGTHESCLWMGQRADVRRVLLRNGAWMGLWTGAYCRDSVFEDITSIDQPNVGIYIEHVTSGCVFRRLNIKTWSWGIVSEWWYQDGVYGPSLPYGGKAGSFDNVIEDFEIQVDDPNGWGIFLDAGTFGYTIRNGRIYGAGNGIRYPANLVDPARPNQIDWASIDMSGLAGIPSQQHSNPIG